MLFGPEAYDSWLSVSVSITLTGPRMGPRLILDALTPLRNSSPLTTVLPEFHAYAALLALLQGSQSGSQLCFTGLNTGGMLISSC